MAAPAPSYDKLKYGTKTPDALQFDTFVTGVESRYDFTTWTFNSAQPSSGITIIANRITITKFKPNVPIITSNFTGTATDSTPTTAELSAITKNTYIKYTGLTANQSLLTNYTKQNEQMNWTANLRGLYFAPYRTTTMGEITVAGYPNWMVAYDDGTTAVQLGDELTIRCEGGGYGRIARITDRTEYTKVLPSWSRFPENQDSHWQLGVGIYTSESTDNDGFITLSTPIVVEIDNTFIVNPTNIEGYRAYCGDVQVYNKDMTFQNVLMRHGCAFKETGTFTEQIQGANVAITSEYNGESNVAWVISDRAYRSDYGHIRLPYISDLGELISNEFPFKLWAKLDRDADFGHIWDSIVEAFRAYYITHPTFANHLFSLSSGYIETLSLTFDVGYSDAQQTEENYIDMMGIFDYSNLVESVSFNITTGILKSLVNAFRQTHTLQAVSFNKVVNVSDFAGAFEGTYLENFPTNLACTNRWQDNSITSEPTCDLHYAADGSRLQAFGIFKDQTQTDPEDMCYTAIVEPYCVGAFSRSAVSEIDYLLDMKFVAPVAGMISETDGGIFNAVFNAPDLAVGFIKNLNKGDWSLDGTARNGLCAGNLEQYDEDSANYLLENLFDLRLNTSDAAHLEAETNSLNNWSASTGTKRPVLFETAADATLSKNLTSGGTMEINLSLYNCTCSLTNGGSTTTLANGDHTLSLTAGTTVFTFTKNSGVDTMGAVLTLTDHFKYELTRGLSAANIYLPADWSTRNIIHSSSVQEANARGWTVYVGGTVYTV